jgi:Zn finger protein HypA/HybF involved in hydrogenase expression
MKFDIEKAPVEFKCPDCGFINKVNFKDVKLERRIICRGCKKTIVLIDKDSSFKQASKDIQKSLNELAKTLKEISNSTNKL